MQTTMEETSEQSRSGKEGWVSLPIHNVPTPSRTDRYTRGHRPGSGSGSIDTKQLALGLGWFSIVLGLAEVTAPQGVAKMVGVEVSRDSRALISAFGVREIANGLAILAQPDNPLWVQARVGGDAVDLTALSIAFGGAKNDQPRVGAAMAAVAGITALDLLCSLQLAGRKG
jgi:hypothetical protein